MEECELRGRKREGGNQAKKKAQKEFDILGLFLSLIIANLCDQTSSIQAYGYTFCVFACSASASIFVLDDEQATAKE